MRVAATNSRSRLLALSLGVLGLAVGGRGRAADEVKAPVAVQFTLDRQIDALAAPFLLATSKGLFREAGLSVTISATTGTREAIARVASGASDLALADLNALIRYRDAADAVPVKAVFVLLNRTPYAVIARKSRGVSTLSSLDGKTLGAADGDLAIRLWPALARRNDVRLATVRQEKISAAVREPMLSAGQLDAVTGFSYLSAINLRDRGVPADDLAVFRYADYGSAAYGMAIIVNPKFAADRPDAVRGFLRAVLAATRIVVAHPEQAIDDVVGLMDGGSRDLELERLLTVMRDNILTEDVKRNGLGGVDPKRFAASLGEIAEDFSFRKRPALADIFDDSFLPDPPGRKID